MKTTARQRRFHPGYSLGEMLAALVIGSLVLVSVLSIYGRANQASEAVARKIDSPALALEVLQLIAEDLDRLVGGANATIEIKNGLDNGFARAQLVLRRTFYDTQNQEQAFDEIIWRAGYDYESGVPGLVIYRSYSGLASEDKLLDSKRDTWEKNYPFVPICRGVTFFSIEVTNGERTSDTWSGPSLPPGVKVSLSFSRPYETVRGTLDVDESQKTSRTIAIDRTRTLRFAVPAEQPQGSTPEQGAEPEQGNTSGQDGAPQQGNMNNVQTLRQRGR